MSEHDLHIFEGGLDERSRAYLLETTRWTKFLAIIGFIVIGLMLILALVMFTMGSYLSSGLSGFGGLGGFFGVGLGLLYIIIAGLYLIPVLSLLRFSTNMKAGIHTNNAGLITEGFRHQKNLFKFFGILTILIIVLYLLLFVIAGLGAFR